MKSPAPVIVFAYNRPEHLLQTLSALRQNELANETEVTVFSDGPKSPEARVRVEKVRAVVRAFQGFKSITLIERASNLGLAKNVISGVTEAVKKTGRVIVLEDDMVTSPVFLRYMNEGLDRYESEERVISIHGYVPPVSTKLEKAFFLRGADCWGWATWERGWALFEADGSLLLKQFKTRKLRAEFDYDGSYPYIQMLKDQVKGRNDSWAIRWYASAFLKDKLTLHPPKSLVQNTGMDGSGTHCDTTKDYQVDLAQAVPSFPDRVEPDARAFFEVARFYRQIRGSYLKRILRTLFGFFQSQ